MTFTCTLFILSLIDVITFKCYSIKYLIPSPAATAISQIDNRMITNNVKETGVVKDFLLTILSNNHFYKKTHYEQIYIFFCSTCTQSSQIL